MGWSLGYLPVHELEFIEAYLSAVGKALYIASNFEKKCLWVFRIAKLVDQYEADPDLHTFQRFADTLRDNLLGPTLRNLGAFDAYTEREFVILEKGREARNYIAHNAAALGHLSYLRREHLEEAATKLRNAVADLVPADNLVSKWVYEIEEKEPAPILIQQGYSETVQQWIFAGLSDA